MQNEKGSLSIKNLVKQWIEDKVIIPWEGIESYIDKIRDTDEKRAKLLRVLVDTEKRAKKWKNPVLTWTIHWEYILNPKKYVELVRKELESSKISGKEILTQDKDLIERTFQHELVRDVISELAWNLTWRHFDDESNLEVMVFLLDFAKAVIPEIIKHKFDITKLWKPIKDVKMIEDFINPLDRMHLNSPELKKIKLSFIDNMVQKFPNNRCDGHDWLVSYGFQKVIRHICLVFNCYANWMDPDILHWSPEEIHESMMKLAEAMAKKWKMPLLVDPSGDPKETAEDIVKYIKWKEDLLNNNLN